MSPRTRCSLGSLRPTSLAASSRIGAERDHSLGPDLGRAGDQAAVPISRSVVEGQVANLLDRRVETSFIAASRYLFRGFTHDNALLSTDCSGLD